MKIKSGYAEIDGKKIYIETGRVAKQANGSAVVTLGETVVLVTAVSTNQIREGIDFLPLTVEYQEMSYGGGRIPGNYFRRDMGRPSERETLSARLIDRPIRPLFPKKYPYEIQVIASVLSTDKKNESDVLAIIGASAALEVSDIPFDGPIAAVRVGRLNGKFIANPTLSQMEESDIDLIVAGNKTAIVMVEGGAKFVKESDIIDAIYFGHEALQPLIDLQLEIKEAVGKPKREIPEHIQDESLQAEVIKLAQDRMNEVITEPNKKARQQKRDQLLSDVTEQLTERYPDKNLEIAEILSDFERQKVRDMILHSGRRIDGRKFEEVRPIDCMVGILPRVHGSALFTRGETQAMVLTTLGTEMEEQRIETIHGTIYRNFIFHYNFPPYCVGETKRLTGPSRREIGHGALARRALLPAMPDKEKFQYAVRVVSEILESNGSSSMASVCGGSLSLMDAGVPIRSAIAGVAMGLVSEGEKTAILTDIIGDEDHYGDMDFKVAGTEDTVTALQMDIKIEGLSQEVMKRALEQAKEARGYILEKMNQVLPKPRSSISPYAPVIETIQIRPEKIRVLIGPGGKTIREIISATDARIEVEDEGRITISAPDKEAMKKTLDMINNLIQEAEVGKVYVGKVRKIMDFGAFVEILPGTDGLVHISQLDKRRVRKVSDILSEGDEVLVKVIGVDKNGRITLSRKAALEEAGSDVP